MGKIAKNVGGELFPDLQVGNRSLYRPATTLMILRVPVVCVFLCVCLFVTLVYCG